MIFKDFKITFGGQIIRTFSFGGGHEARHRLEVKAELVVSQLDLGYDQGQLDLFYELGQLDLG